MIRPLPILAMLALCSPGWTQTPIVLPQGYVSTVFHQEPPGSSPTSLSQDSQGRTWLLTLDGQVRILEDLDANGAAETVTLFWDGSTYITPPALGVLWTPTGVLVSHQSRITRLEDTNNDDTPDIITDVVTGLPTGLHQNNQMFTDGTTVWFGLGSITDHMTDPDPRSATLMRMNPDGTGLSVAATGLRNVFDGVAHSTRGVFVGDNGPNLVPGNPDPVDEICQIQPGGHYGHPGTWGTGGPPGSLDPLVVLPPHAAPCGMAENPNTLLSGHRGELIFVAYTAAGGSVVRVPLHNGTGTGALGAWLEPWSIGIVGGIDCAFDPEGALLIADFLGRTVWRVRPENRLTAVVETPPSIGSSCRITLNAPDFPNRWVWAAVSTGLAPSPLSIGPGVNSYLDLTDPLWALSGTAGNPYFAFPSPGPLDGQGQATADIAVPNDPFLIGFAIEFQFVALDLGSTWTFLGASPTLRLYALPAW